MIDAGFSILLQQRHRKVVEKYPVDIGGNKIYSGEESYGKGLKITSSHVDVAWKRRCWSISRLYQGVKTLVNSVSPCLIVA